MWDTYLLPTDRGVEPIKLKSDDEDCLKAGTDADAEEEGLSFGAIAEAEEGLEMACATAAHAPIVSSIFELEY